VDAYGAVVADINPDQVFSESFEGRTGGLDHRLDGPLHIPGGDAAAVVEPGVSAKLYDPGPTVGRHLPRHYEVAYDFR
jgi:hypothetical protein